MPVSIFDRPRRDVVLIVEDDPLTGKVLQLLLLAHGYTTCWVTSADEAVVLLASQEAPKVIVLDLVLPGTCGLELAKRLRDDGMTRAIPIIVISSLDGGVEQSVLRPLGIIDYLRKPLDLEAVVARIAGYAGPA